MSCHRTPEPWSRSTAVRAASSSAKLAATTMPPATSGRYDWSATAAIMSAAAAATRRSCPPREDGNAHLIGGHPPVRSAMQDDLPVDAHDRCAAVVSDHRAHLADAPPRHRRVATTEQ